MAGPAISNLTSPASRGGTIRGHFEPVVADATVLAASDGTTNVLIAAKTGFTLFITRILVAITTDAAQTLTFQDSAGTPVVIAKTKSSPGLGPIEFTFGEDGTPLTEAKSLDLNISAAGLAGRVHVEGYYRRTAVGTV
jgi:hypothetical protein